MSILIKLPGKVLSPGFAYGRIHVINEELLGDNTHTNTGDQKQILEDAINAASAKLYDQMQTATLLFSDRISVIFEVHRLMISDPALLETTYRLIEEGKSAYDAYKQASEEVILLFKKLDNEYMRHRIVDIEDATSRVLYAIQSKSYEVNLKFDDSRIVIMKQMKPSIIFACEKNDVLGFITENGSYNQHAAIIARTKDLVSMIVPGIFDQKLRNGDFLFIDGDNSCVYLNPTHDFVNKQLEERR